MTPCQAACAALARAGCAEGKAANCVTVFAHVESDRLVRDPARGNQPLTCAEAASLSTAAEMRAHEVPCH